MVAFTVSVSTLALIALFAAIDILFTKQVFLVKNICFGMFSFFGMFLIVSGLLFAFDRYGLWFTYGICFVFGLITLLITFTVKYKTIKELKIITQITGLPQGFTLCLVGLLILGTVVSWSKFEYRGMGQDQGVYATAALYRIAGYNDIQIDLDGYHILEDINDKALFRESIYYARSGLADKYGNNLAGYYTYTQNEFFTNEPVSDISGFMHGIPNYSALLSISGFIFGISGILHIQTLLFLSAIALFFIMLCHNLRLKIFTGAVMTTLFILSPIVVWTTKSSLTESVISLIIVVFMYLITSNDKHSAQLLWLPIAVFAFYHVSVYILMPLFVILFIILYIQKRDSNIIVSGVISLLAYFAGVLTMFFSSDGYAYNNYRTAIRKTLSFLNPNYIELTVFLAFSTLTAIIILLIGCFLIKRMDLKINTKIYSIISKYIMLAGVFYVVVIYVRGFVLHYINDLPNNLSSIIMIIRGMISGAPTLSLVAFTFLSGFIILPIVLYGLFKKRGIFFEDKIIPIVTLFLYCVIIYSAFVRRKIEYYYYFTRYLAPFISIILVMGAIYFDTFRFPSKIAISCVAVLLTIPFTLFILTNKDHSRMQWSTLEQVIETVDELSDDDVVVVSKSSMIIFFLPLNALTNTTILPHENFKYLEDKLENPGNGKVYYLSNNKAEHSNPAEFSVKTCEYTIVRGILPPLPFEAKKRDYTMYLNEITHLEEMAAID